MKTPHWLAHLRTDRRGLPVPYVNRWGKTERTELLSIRQDGYAARPGVFYDDRGELEPDFTAQNMHRQRECILAGLCQVCGRQIPWSRRYLVVAAMSCEQIEIAGGPVTVITEPWLDERCAELAIEVCPALIRRHRADDLMLVPVTRARQVELVLSTGWIEGELEAESRRVDPAMWAKILLLDPVIKLAAPPAGGEPAAEEAAAQALPRDKWWAPHTGSPRPRTAPDNTVEVHR